MLQRAYALAIRRRDRKNATLIASSLAEHYVEEGKDQKTAEMWLGRLDVALKHHFDKTESRLLKDLSKKLRATKSQ
jgi:hypothetical protein